MLDVCLLGTGGMMPLPSRYLTSLMVRYNGKSILVDCGEGTQVAMKKKGWSPKPIDVMCFTHYHADHISGLPGMLLTLGNADRTEPVLMIGPPGLERVVSALRVVAPELPFDIVFHELSHNEEKLVFGDLTISAFKVSHNVTCYGYSFELARAGMFQVEKAKELGIPVQMWSLLQKGETVEYEGKKYKPSMVMGKPRKGIRLTYCTDTRPTASIKEHAKDADLFICEGMYGQEDKLARAKEHRHMMMQEAASIAKEAGAERLWLTHYSPAMPRPRDYMDEVCKIFPKTVAAKDGQSIEIGFTD
ncbi:MAG: ribonuclease Z [Lachnospiraceae bacterium]|nr:ribonuclease Z [Lachnospiraceae bacterium]